MDNERNEVNRTERNIKNSQSALNRVRSMEAMRAERKKDVTITFHEAGETFTIKERVAIPLLEALRLYKKNGRNPGEYEQRSEHDGPDAADTLRDPLLILTRNEVNA